MTRRGTGQDLPTESRATPTPLLIAASRLATGTTEGPGGTQVARTFPACRLWSSARYTRNLSSPTNSSHPSPKDILLPNSNQWNVLYINRVIKK